MNKLKLNYNILGKTGRKVSEVGFGTYRVSAEEKEHRTSLKHALKNGINLIDTSSNYTDGLSEQCIGKVLYECIEDKIITRDDIIIITKGGYLQGENLEYSKSLEKRGSGFPERVVFSEYLEHCIHPICLNNQLEKSLNHMGLDYVDVYLLHNPEYYLTWCMQENIDKETARDEFYRRIKEAFIFLEEKVAEGKIKSYGVSSNTVGYHQDAYEHVSLKTLLEIAESITPNHHFHVLQAPCNLIENNIATLKNNDAQTVLEFAKAHNIAVLANRPLNAIVDQQLFRLAEHDIEEGIAWLEVDDAIQTIIQMEMTNPLEIDSFELPEEEEKIVREAFCLGSDLHASWQQFKSIDNWTSTIQHYIYPRIENAIHVLHNNNCLTKEDESWVYDYIAEINNALKSITLYLKVDASNKIDNLRFKIEEKEKRLVSSKTFSQTALAYLRGLEGLTCTLVGMRRENYVNDVLVELIQSKVNVNPHDIPNQL